ncbi:DUF6959 family protein [Streptomyces sp. NPDC002104]
MQDFPGVLIQGDTLSSLQADVAEIIELCTRGDLEEARSEAALSSTQSSARSSSATRMRSKSTGSPAPSEPRLSPDHSVAARIRTEFADALDTPAGLPSPKCSRPSAVVGKRTRLHWCAGARRK